VVLQRLEPRVDARQQLERLKENLGAISVELTADDLREIESAASKITIQGERYPEHLEKRTGL
jgi:diketogulonate reductase-like aldo/keto reductase